MNVFDENLTEYVKNNINNCLMVVLQDSVIHNSNEELDDKNINDVENGDNIWEWDDSKFVFVWYAKFLSELYDNFTFTKYSKKPWFNWYASISYPLSDNISATFSESVYYTLELGNPNRANLVTDLMWSYDINEKLSVGVWAELSIYPSNKDENMLAGFLMADYHPNDKFSVNVVSYKPICLLDWKGLPDFYLLGTFSYNISDKLDKKFLFRTMTNCSDGWKTQAAFGFSFPIYRNFSWEVTSIPNKTWIVPWWALVEVKYTIGR